MLEDGRCSLCEIPEHHSTAVPVAPVPATPSTTRRHARHVLQAGERKQYPQLPDIGEIRLHSSHMRHSNSPEAAPVSDHHKPHTLSQFTNLNYIPRHDINEEPIYSSRSRHAANEEPIHSSRSRHAINEEPIHSSRSRHTVNEEPTFIQELSSYMKKNHQSYDGGSNGNLNNNDLNYTQNPNALSDEHIYGYATEPSYKINNIPRVHPRSKSNSYNNQILNPKGLYSPNSRLHENSKSNTLPTNMLSQRHGSQVSSMHDVDQDYFLNMQKSRFSLDGMKKRETRKQRLTIQSVVLIGCFSLLFVVGVIMFVAVCYQNGWLGLGKETPQEDNFPRRPNELNRRYDRIGNFPDNVHRQRGTGSGRTNYQEYPRIGLSGGRRSQPPVYEDRDYQQSQRFTRRVGHQAVDNHHVNNPIDGLPKTYNQSPRFARLVDDQTVDNNHVNSPIDELPQAASLVDNPQISTVTNSLLHDGVHPDGNLQSSYRHEESELTDDQWSLTFTDNNTSDFDGIGQNLNSNSHFLRERVVINVPHHSIELSHNGNFENTRTSNVKDKVTNMLGLGRYEETIPLNQSDKILMNESDISQDNSSTPSSSVGSKSVPLQSHENLSPSNRSEGSKTVPIESLSLLLKNKTSRSRILSVVAGVLISSNPP